MEQRNTMPSWLGVWYAERPLLICLLVVNLLWALYVLLAVSVLLAPLADPQAMVRALIRVGVVLIPASLYCWGWQSLPLLDSLGLRRNWRIGVGVVLLWFVPILLYQVRVMLRSVHLPRDWALWVNVILGSPFAEEVLYRGVVLRVLSRGMAPWQAVLWSAGWFTLLHLPWWLLTRPGVAVIWELAGIFIYGVVFAVLVAATRSVWAALLPHWINNLISMSLAQSACETCWSNLILKTEIVLVDCALGNHAR